MIATNTETFTEELTLFWKITSTFTYKSSKKDVELFLGNIFSDSKYNAAIQSFMRDTEALGFRKALFCTEYNNCYANLFNASKIWKYSSLLSYITWLGAIVVASFKTNSECALSAVLGGAAGLFVLGFLATAIYNYYQYHSKLNDLNRFFNPEGLKPGNSVISNTCDSSL